MLAARTCSVVPSGGFLTMLGAAETQLLPSRAPQLRRRMVRTARAGTPYTIPPASPTERRAPTREVQLVQQHAHAHSLGVRLLGAPACSRMQHELKLHARRRPGALC